MAKAPLIVAALPQMGIYREILLGFRAIGATLPWKVIFASSEPAMRQALDGGDVYGLILNEDGARWMRPGDWDGRVIVGANVDLTHRGIPSVLVHDELVGRIAARYLIEKGLASYAAYSYQCFPWSVNRARGFRDEVQSAGLRYCGTGEVFRSDIDETDPRYPKPEHIQAWLRSLPRPTGVVVCTDGWAMQMTSACAAEGLRVPEDIPLVGVDNEEFFCEMVHPTLSSVMIPWRRLGNEAALLLEMQLAGVQPETLVTRVEPGNVTERQSSNMLAVPDPHVVAALQFIRAHAGDDIQLRDVLLAVPVYRQKLEASFRKYLGRTIMQEVRRMHIEQASKLLATTGLSAGEIALRCGFPNLCRLSKAFRAQTGMTPIEYRQQFRALPR